MAIKDYNVDPDLNVQISGINIAEGCPPSGINNAIRQLMADVKAEQDVRGEEWATQAAKDAEQDAAIAEAKSSADAAQNTADEALAAAEEAKDAAANITVPVTSVNGQTGAVTVGTVRTVNGVSADAAGNVAISTSPQIASVGYLSGNAYSSGVTYVTSSTSLHLTFKSYKLPAGGTWVVISTYNCRKNVSISDPDISAGQSFAGGSTVYLVTYNSSSKENIDAYISLVRIS